MATMEGTEYLTCDWIENLAAGMVNALDFLKGESLEQTFRRVVLRERP